MGPKKVDYSNLEFGPEEDERRAFFDQRLQSSIESEESFDEILVLRTPSEEDLALLLEARNAQRDYVEGVANAASSEVQRLEALSRRYQNFAVQKLEEQSRVLENKAAQLAEAEKIEEALAMYLQALELQEAINEEYPLSDAHDPSRVARLKRKAGFLVAEPLYRESLAYEQLGDEKFSQKDWLAAQEAFEKALGLQDTLNRKHRGTRQANVARYDALRKKLIGVLSGEEYTRIQEVVELADSSKVSGDNLVAASHYSEAARLQKLLNLEYPESPYASTDRVSDFQRKSQTAQSYQLGLEIESNHENLRVMLSSQKNREAIETIVDLRRDILHMQETYPRSSLNDANLQTKIRYLNLIQNDIEFIQEHLYRRMRLLPDSEDWSMLTTEVTQGLYSIVMGTNPSRIKADNRPVDSVSWREAQTFCERLKWIMGKPVRLPNENEFRNALGSLRYLVLEEYTWSALDSDAQAQAVASKKAFGNGYFDLLGNVSEWLESTDRFEGEDAKHIGGHAQDSIEAIFTVPVRNSPRGERNRMTGFRIVAQLK
ncbi:MAG: SUMF1/EgtB/PvdO family nonheme iron enzyme [Coraliomargaritaceae bacterium]